METPEPQLITPSPGLRPPSPKGGGVIRGGQYLQPLVAAGLEPDQAEVYEILLKNGPLKAGKIAQKSPLKRGLVYKILDELVSLGLVIKNEPTGKVAVFEPAHPLKVKELAEAKEQKLKTAQLALDGILGQLTSDYNLALNKPGVQFFEGVDGLKKIYEDILRTKQNFYLIRSGYEPSYNDLMLPSVKEFIKKRVGKKIRVTAITPLDELTKNHNPTSDKEMLMERIPISKSDYNAPVEIDVYGSKIAILSFGKELMGITIDSPQISSALKQIFVIIQKSVKPRLP